MIHPSFAVNVEALLARASTFTANEGWIIKIGAKMFPLFRFTDALKE
jgi:hypothetical protein